MTATATESGDQKFISARRGAFSGWIGVIYVYDGRDKEYRFWASPVNRETKTEAIDDAVEYAEENNIEIESIDF